MKRTEIPNLPHKEIFKWLMENKNLIMAERKAYPKFADSISYMCPVFDKTANSFKAASENADLLSKDELTARLAINTTNIMDSHKDVHMPGLWKRSLKNNGKRMLLLEAHDMSFDKVIADALEGEIKAFIEVMKWKELGFDFKGETEVLLFEAIIRKSNNEKMFGLYAKGRVKNHSVGMNYVEYHMCINSQEKYYIDEYENWEKYFPEVVNQEDAEACGYFFAVTEAKAFEGSAVPRGSNYATPTLEIKSDPSNHSLHKEDDPDNHSSVDYSYLTKNLKLN